MKHYCSVSGQPDRCPTSGRPPIRVESRRLCGGPRGDGR